MILKEKTTIEVERYSINGMPVCIQNYRKGEFCVFYMSSANYNVEECFFCGKLQRTDDRDWLIPSKDCPVWKDR